RSENRGRETIPINVRFCCFAETRRGSAGLAVHRIRVRHQPPNGQSAWPRSAQRAAIARRRGDRVNRRAFRTPQKHGPSSIANETVFEPRGLNRELRSLVHQKAGMTLLWSEVLGSFPEGLAPAAGKEAAAPPGPGAGERLGCESSRREEPMPRLLVPRRSRAGFDRRDRPSTYRP